MEATLLGPFTPSIQGGPAAADAAIGTGASAVIAHNDLLAIGALRRFAERGVQVPADISVVGFDDIFGADFCAPPLTTVSGPLEAVGRTAVDLVLSSLQKAGRTATQQLRAPAHLVIRGSTGPVSERTSHT
ncbi:substrate-binding domain-containing protein [Rhodococcus sp. NPDC057529]|uniref:substrate-binding domain-containing protein n=1 Tax=Rhodococcus sp. NPDC057529 TaxID=3346158 RepID=UPI00366EC5D9